MRGRLFVIEGLDGSGKATQTAQLIEKLRAQGRQVTPLSFPCYESDSSALVRMYLGGAFGADPGAVNAYAASAFYAVDRYASFQTGWRAAYERGGLFVADRYATSNAVYQMGKLPHRDWDGYLDWLADFEYARLGVPAPDAVVYLDLPPELGAQLMRQRYGGDESKKDIHEKNLQFQQTGREAALYCARRQGWRTVACSRQGALRPVEEIADEVYAIIKEWL